jgi:hypothetical protein
MEKRGEEIVVLEISAADNPWVLFAGMFKADPLFDEWQAAIAKRRQESDWSPRGCPKDLADAMARWDPDTDTLSLFQRGHPSVCAAAAARSREDIAVTVITVEEQLSGWYALLRRSKERGELVPVYRRGACSGLLRVVGRPHAGCDREAPTVQDGIAVSEPPRNHFEVEFNRRACRVSPA